jgi:hypothetical protein
MIIDSSQLDGSLRSACDNMPYHWQVSEWYLDLNETGYEVSVINENVIKLSEHSKKENFFLTVLKVVSYLTLILPVIAFIIKTIYRKQYQYEVSSVGGVDGLQKSLNGDKKSADDLQRPTSSISALAATQLSSTPVSEADLKIIQEDRAGLSQSPKSIGNGNGLSVRENEFLSWKRIIGNNCKFTPNMKPDQLVEKCKKVINYFSELYDCGISAEKEIDVDGKPGESPAAKKTVRSFPDRIQNVAKAIASGILLAAYKNKENPPPEFLAASPSKAILLLKSTWEAELAH